MIEYGYLYTERMAIMTENGATEAEAKQQAIYEVRKKMVEDGIDFYKANLMILGIAKNEINSCKSR